MTPIPRRYSLTIWRRIAGRWKSGYSHQDRVGDAQPDGDYSVTLNTDGNDFIDDSFNLNDFVNGVRLPDGGDDLLWTIEIAPNVTTRF